MKNNEFENEQLIKQLQEQIKQMQTFYDGKISDLTNKVSTMTTLINNKVDSINGITKFNTGYIVSASEGIYPIDVMNPALGGSGSLVDILGNTNQLQTKAKTVKDAINEIRMMGTL